MNWRQRVKGLDFLTIGPSLLVLGLYLVSFSFVAWILSTRFASLQSEISASTAATRSLLEVTRLRAESKECLLLFRLTHDTRYLGKLDDIELEKSLNTNRLANEVQKIDPKDHLMTAYLEGSSGMRNLRTHLLEAIANRNEARAARLFDSYNLTYDINSARLADLHARIHGRLTKSESKMRSLLENLPWLLLSEVLIAIILSFAMVRYYRRRILAPLSLLHSGMGAVADGRLGDQLCVPSTAFEITEMLQDFNKMTSHLHTTREELKHAREEAMLAASVKSEFLANMSHEIRTPLNVIIGLAGVISERPLEAELKREIDIMHRSGQHLLGVVNDILDYSRLESGLVTVHEEIFDIREVIGNVGSIVEPLARMKGVSLIVSVAPDTPKKIRSDAQLFAQALLNLANNSVKFTKQGSVTISARVNSHAGDAILQISVVDTGIGISEEKLGRLFNRFAQADESITRTHGGTGLGLAIVKQISTLLKGDIDVSSTEGVGSTFTMKIPVINAEAGCPNRDRRPVQEFFGFSRSPRILLADDSTDNRYLIKKYVESYGACVVEACNGKDALRAFCSGSYDVVLMDVQMPEMDGYQATREIRRFEISANKSRTPVVALTAFALKEEVQRSLDNGCDSHLAKPVSKKDLLQLIESYLVQTAQSKARGAQVTYLSEVR